MEVVVVTLGLGLVVGLGVVGLVQVVVDLKKIKQPKQEKKKVADKQI